MFEYVGSGLGAARLNHSYFEKEQENIDYFNQWAKLLNGFDDLKFSALYNAYTEKGFPDSFKRSGIYSNFQNIYADSGGLQMVTFGKSITDEVKDEIYRNQALHSKFAMCFDEIPLKVTGRSKIGDTDGRIFDRNNLKEYAKETAKNIQRQIDIFKEMESDAVPCVIVHGQDMDSYLQWSDEIIKGVKQEDHKYLTTVAISSACIGVSDSPTEIERNFMIKNLPFEYLNHSHVLGVGSLKRLLSSIIFFQNGFFETDFKVSFDSTTHTKLSIMGQYWKDGRVSTLTKTMNKNYEILYSEIENLVPMNMTLEEFHLALTNSVTDYDHKYNNSIHVIKAVTGLTCYSIYSFMNYFRKHLHSKSVLLDNINNDRRLFELLYKVQSLEDYQDWKEQCGGFFKRKKSFVRDKAISTFEALI